MKLHLPVRLFKSVLACLAAVASFSLGSGVAWAEAQNLTFSGSSLIWDTSAENKPFVDEEDAAASFAAGDNVSFTGESAVTLGENITAGTLDIAAGADVTIDLEEYTLHTDTISLSGTLDVGDSLSIASGSTLAVKNDTAVLDSALVLGEKSGLVVESSASLNNNTLTLQGGSNLILTAAGDGKTYTLFTGISGLLGADGSALELTAENNAISNYFDTTRPGTGFWADATLVYAADGSLQIVRHNETVKDALEITESKTGTQGYNYYKSISFLDCSIYSDINGVDGDNIELSNNGIVTFSGNTASSDRAIFVSVGGTIMLSNNGSVEFSGYTASSGGAIMGEGTDSTVLSNNGSVTFKENMAFSTSSYALGGAICGAFSTIKLSNNGRVEFCGNKTSSSSYHAYGGAIYGDRDIVMAHNGSVWFSGNEASSSSSPSCGGAIYSVAGGCSLSYNDIVSFRGNKASSTSSTACGGAIYGADRTDVTLRYNGNVVFEGNTASSSACEAYGGAIYGRRITLSNNARVLFNENMSTLGGAIFTDVSLHIRNNDSVLFEKNAEVENGTYRLRSIYAGGSDAVISLSAAVDKSLEFRDSVYVDSGSTVDLNADYTYVDSEGVSVTIKQQGDILFTGKYTETHLNELLASAEAGRTATAEEILNSRTTEVNALTNLYGGRLRVEDGAIYQGQGITVHEGSEATVRVKDATLSHSGYDLTFNAGTTLELAGSNTITGNVQMLEGSWLAFDGTESKGMSWLTGNLSFTGGANVSLSNNTDWSGQNEILMYVDGSVSGWDENTLGIRNDAGSSTDLRLVNGDLLVLNYNAETFKPYFKGDLTITTRQTGLKTYNYYEGICFRDITYTADNSDLSSACEAYGGAIYGSDITLSNNASVKFIGNKIIETSSAYGYACGMLHGGAIYGSDITLSNNGSVEFCGNQTVNDMGLVYMYYGGAIYGSDITLNNNARVLFNENMSTLGGAIYGSDITLSNNGSVEFCGNSSYRVGGAIYTDGSLHIRNNESVEFAGNVEDVGYNNPYRLRSVYVSGGSGDVLSISAAAGKSVVFYDTIYVGSGTTVNLNSDYEDAEGNIIEQKGDIVFTGATTVADLYKAKGNVDGTEEEIRLSRTTEVNALTNLYGGRLRVEDGAIYQGQGITAHEGSGATVRVKDATLSHSGYDLTFNAGTTLELEGINSIAGNVVMKGISMLAFNYDAALLDAASMSLSGSLTLNGEIALQLKGFEEHEGAYKLISLSSATLSGWGDENIRLHGTDGTEIAWDKLFRYGDTVYYVNQNLGTATWTNSSGDGKWNNFSYNWEENGKNYAYTQGVDVVFGSETSGSTITLEGDHAVRNMQVTGESSYEIQYTADSSLRIDSALQVESGSSLSLGGAVSAGEVQNAGTMTVLGDMTVQGAVNGAGALTVDGALSAASLTLTGAEATSRITGDVVLRGAATVAGALEVGGSFTSGTLQAKSLTVDTFISTGKLTGDSNTLTALNGNIELTNEHESLNGNSNVITATGGDVRLTDNMTGSGNVITAVAANGVGGSILRGNGTALWASIAGQNNELTADGNIELESINQGNNTLHAKTGSIVISAAVSGGNNTLTAGTTISAGSMTGSGNTLTAGGGIVNAGGTISLGNINGNSNVLAAENGSIKVRDIGNTTKSDNNSLTAAGHVYVQGKLIGDGNYIESNKAPGDGNSISIWNGIEGNANRILANAGNIAMGGGDLTGDNNTLTSVNGNVSVRNVSGTGNTLSAVDGDIVASSIAGTAASLSAASLQINGSGGLNLVDSALNITGDITSVGAVVLAGADNTVLWNAGRFSGSGSVSITGGSLELADDTDALAVTGAVSISNAELRGSWTGTGLSVGGSSVAQGAAVVLRDVTLTSSLSNEGSLSFGGAVAVQADGLVSASSFTKYSAGESGYRYEEKAYTLVTGRGSSAALDGTVWSLSGDVNAPSDACFSYADGILTATGAQDLSAYWVNGAVQYDGSSEFAAAASLVLNGGHLTMSQGLGTNLTGGIRVDKSSTLTLGNGVEVKRAQLSGVSSDNTVSLDGSGKLNLGSSADFTGYALAKGWSGTVKLENITTDTNLNFGQIGQSGSTIELENVMGYTGVKNGTVAANLVLNKSTAADGTEQAAFLVSNGYSSTTEGYVMTTFSGAVSGEGKMVFNRSLNDTHIGLKFIGNVVGWTGAFEMQGGKTFNLEFSGNATEIKADIRDVSSGGTLNLVLGADAAMTLSGAIDTDSITVSNAAGASFCNTVSTGTLSAAGSAVTFGAAATVSGDMSATAVVLNQGGSLDVGGALSAGQVTLKELSTTAPTLTVGSFAAGDTIFSLDVDTLNVLNLVHGQSVVIARADTAIGSDFAAWLAEGSTSLDAVVYRYDLSVSGSDVMVSMDYANWGTRVWYEGAWVGKDGWDDYLICGYDAVNGVETVNLGGSEISDVEVLFLAPEDSSSTTVLSNGSIEAACTEIVEGNLTIAEDASLDSDELIAAGHDILLQGELIVNNGSIGTLSGTTGTLVIGGEVSVDSNVTLGILDNSGTLDIGSHKLNVAAVVSNGGNVTAGEVVVHNRYGNPAEFDTLVADKVTVTNTSSKYPDYLSVGGGSVIGELVADKLEVREGTATLGSTAKQTEQELQSIALQKGADLVLQGQTSLSVTDSVAMTAGSEVQIQSGSTLQNGAIALSAAPGTAAAQLSSKAGGDLVMMQQAGGLCIQDVLMMNTCISAAEGTEVMLSGVEGSENVHLLGGADFSLTFADNKADVGMAVIENSSPVTGITLSAGSTLTLVMDPSNNLFADYSLIINMTGFEYEGGNLAAAGGITELNAAGIYLGGWLGQLLADQGVEQESAGALEAPVVTGDSVPSISYTYSTENNVGMVISISGLSVPEPTTTTLSLLALAALAARRRRK